MSWLFKGYNLLLKARHRRHCFLVIVKDEILKGNIKHKVLSHIVGLL